MDAQPTWDWSAVGDASAPQQGPAQPPTPPNADTETSANANDAPPEPQARASGRRYGPRTCRICLDTEEPKYPTDATTTFGISSASSRPTYVSDDPELGRLLSPCKCKGSQKYVHEGCLNAWRLANPTQARNYWQCPTCKFTYRMARLHWASALSSKWTQIALTFVVFIVSIFALGFVADPLLDLWLDPVGTISETVTNVVADVEALKEPSPKEYITWYEHFIKGFFSLGLVGLAKAMFAMTPLNVWSLRVNGAFGGGRRQGTGRARVENMNLYFVAIGAVTFLMGTWKVVRSVSARVLQHVSDSVIDIGDGDDDDEEGQETNKDQ